MGGRSREDQILAAGLAKLEFDPTLTLSLTPLCRAIAAMIAEATKPKVTRAKNPEASSYYSLGWDIWSRLKEAAPDAVAWEPVQSRTLYALGKAAAELGWGVYTDMALGFWLARGGLDWMREKPTTSYIARNFADLVAKAKAAPTRGGKDSPLDRLRDR